MAMTNRTKRAATPSGLAIADDFIGFGEAFGLLRRRLPGLTEGELFFMAWEWSGEYSEASDGLEPFQDGVRPPTKFDFNSMSLSGGFTNPAADAEKICFRRRDVENFTPKRRWIGLVELQSRWATHISSVEMFFAIVVREFDRLMPQVPGLGIPRSLRTKDDPVGPHPEVLDEWAFVRLDAVEAIEKERGFSPKGIAVESDAGDVSPRVVARKKGAPWTEEEKKALEKDRDSLGAKKAGKRWGINESRVRALLPRENVGRGAQGLEAVWNPKRSKAR